MTKIYLGTSATAIFEMLKTPFGLLLHPNSDRLPRIERVNLRPRSVCGRHNWPPRRSGNSCVPRARASSTLAVSKKRHTLNIDIVLPPCPAKSSVANRNLETLGYRSLVNELLPGQARRY